MAEAGQKGGKLNVFISYSRDDLAFADQLDAALGVANFATSIDRHGISAGEDWKTRLGALIRDSDTVVFVLSPSSARSPICAWEVEEAGRLGKRILPVLCRPLEGANAPPQLEALNYIFFYAEPRFPGSGFGTGLVQLTSALNTDLDWLREHTRYLQRATEWHAGGRPANRLLSGPDIATAKAWAARRPKNAPEPTPLQLDLIKASETEEVRQQSAEAQRLKEMAEAQDERARALAEREAAQKREAEAQKREAEEARRVVQRTRAGLAAAIALTGVAAWFAWTSYRANQDTQRQLDRANQALAESINNDLGLESGKPLTPRQREALWKLAVADEPTKRAFVSILATSREETVRVSPGLAQISRALGLLAANQALDLVLKQIGQTADPYGLRALAQALQALPAKLTEAQVSQALAPVLNQIDQTTDRFGLRAPVQALLALASKLSEAQASQALDPVLKQIGQTTDPYALGELAQALQALPAKLTEAQASQALDPVLKQIETTYPYALRELAQELQALPEKLTEAQASQALDPVLEQIGQATDPGVLQALAQALQALSAKLTDAQASQALDPVLKQIGLKQFDQTTNPYAFRALAQAFQALAAKLTEAQASQALDPVLKQIGQATDPGALQALAQALQALSAKLTEAQAAQASRAAAASLAWAADDGEAAEWARALATLSRPAANRDGMLVNAIAYPAAAGSATEVFLDAIRAGHPDAPAKEKGTEAALKWLAQKFPDALRPPLCPKPLQSGLKCPPQETSPTLQ